MRDEVDNQIREMRLRHGITQEDLAAAVGVSRQSINSIERGRYVPSLPLALKFSHYFQCSVNELFEIKEV